MKFVRAVKYLAVKGRNELLVYDGYGEHMALRVLELFKRNCIVAYELPLQKNSRTQSLGDINFVSSSKSSNLH